MICTKKTKENIKILLFGSSSCTDNAFLSSFCEISISFVDVNNFNINDLYCINFNNFDSIINIDVKSLNIELKPTAKNIIKQYDVIYQFGFQSILNDKNERIIIIIGGLGGASIYTKSLMLYNCVTKRLDIKQNVCII